MKFLKVSIILLFITLGFINEVKAQSDVMLTQYWAMPTLINPAATGDIDFIRVRAAGRLDLLGSKDSPKYYLAAGDAPFKLLGKRIGAGLVINSASYDLFRNLLIGAQGSYKFNIKKSTLSIGLQIGYFHSKFKGSELTLADLGGGDDEPSEKPPGEETRAIDGTGTDDPNDLPLTDVSGGAMDLTIGVRFEHPKFYVGLTGMHLTNTKLKLTTHGESSTDTRFVESKLPMTLYFDAGGNIAINNSLFTLQPSLLIGTDFSDFNGLVEMRATYNQRVTFGVDYRYNRAFGVIAGISIKNFYLGYNWEYDYKSHPRGSTGNHELVLGYQFKLDMGGKNTFSQRSIRIM